jgi:hypothetical protein
VTSPAAASRSNDLLLLELPQAPQQRAIDAPLQRVGLRALALRRERLDRDEEALVGLRGEAVLASLGGRFEAGLFQGAPRRIAALSASRPQRAEHGLHAIEQMQMVRGPRSQGERLEAPFALETQRRLAIASTMRARPLRRDATRSHCAKPGRGRRAAPRSPTAARALRFAAGEQVQVAATGSAADRTTRRSCLHDLLDAPRRVAIGIATALAQLRERHHRWQLKQ